MDFNKVKQLERAGFHVRPVDEFKFRYRKDGPILSSGCINVLTKNGEEVEVPTLAELIEFVDGEKVLEDITNDYVDLAIKKLENK